MNKGKSTNVIPQDEYNGKCVDNGIKPIPPLPYTDRRRKVEYLIYAVQLTFNVNKETNRIKKSAMNTEQIVFVEIDRHKAEKDGQRECVVCTVFLNVYCCAYDSVNIDSFEWTKQRTHASSPSLTVKSKCRQ